MKWSSWCVLAFVGSLIFLMLHVKDQQITTGVDRLKKWTAPQSVLEADPDLKLISERSPYMRTERWHSLVRSLCQTGTGGARVLEAASDQAIAACGGDAREAVKALIVANHYHETDLEKLKAAA
jgi:hypothetical protein